MTETLYTKYPDACAELEQRGYLGIVGMAKIMPRSSEVARALGFAENGSGPAKWFTGANSPSFASDQKARNWLATHTAPDVAPKGDQEVAAASTQFAVNHTTPAPKKTLLLLTCAPSERKRVEKILTMLDCEVVEV